MPIDLKLRKILDELRIGKKNQDNGSPALSLDSSKVSALKRKCRGDVLFERSKVNTNLDDKYSIIFYLT